MFSSVKVEDFCKYLELNEKETEKITQAFTGNEGNMYEMAEYVGKNMPDVYGPYDFVFDREKQEYKKPRIDCTVLLNNFPVDIHSERYRPLKETLRCWAASNDENEVQMRDVIDAICEYYITDYNALAEKHNTLVEDYNKNKKYLDIIKTVFMATEATGFTKPEKQSEQAKEKKPAEGFVYLANTDTENVYKIGATRNITEREAALRVGNVFLKIFAYTLSANMYKTESLFHEIFKKKNIGGEWFVLDKDDVDYLIQCMGFSLFIEAGNEQGN